MKIAAEKLEWIQGLQCKGDVPLIVEENPGLSEDMVSKATNGKECSWKTCEAVLRFYKQRQDTIDELTPKSLTETVQA